MANNIQKILQLSFLGKVYQSHKLLFFVFVGFIVGQAFFTYKGVETVPFFHFGMFSEPKPVLDTYPLFVAKVDGKKLKLKDNPQYNYDLIQSTLSYYLFLEGHHFNDPIVAVIEKRFKGKVGEGLYAHLVNSLSNPASSQLKYQAWLANMIQEKESLPPQQLSIEIESYRYTHQGFELVHTRSLFDYAY